MIQVGAEARRGKSSVHVQSNGVLFSPRGPMDVQKELLHVPSRSPSPADGGTPQREQELEVLAGSAKDTVEQCTSSTQMSTRDNTAAVRSQSPPKKITVSRKGGTKQDAGPDGEETTRVTRAVKHLPTLSAMSQMKLKAAAKGEKFCRR